jgi:hypothetical protein
MMMTERPTTAERRDLEDMSTLGMDWDNETLETAAVTNAEQGSVATGDVDEEDIEADKRKYLEKHAMVVDGFKCPDEFVKIITPMEFEELVNLFTKFDVDPSNTIDKHETKKVLLYLGMEASMDMAKELLEIIDIDESGEIDFNEFCNFIVMLKRGDPRLQGYGAMLQHLNSTPLGELERQASGRNLKIRFVIVEKREATLTQPTNYIVEVRLTGLYHTLVNGEVEARHMTKKFQGIGQTTKEAKYAAASNALLNLGESMPGILDYLTFHNVERERSSLILTTNTFSPCCVRCRRALQGGRISGGVAGVAERQPAAGRGPRQGGGHPGKQGLLPAQEHHADAPHPHLVQPGPLCGGAPGPGPDR